MDPKKWAGIVISIFDKIDFKKKIKINRKRHFKLIKEKNSPRGCYKFKYLFTKPRGSQVHERNTATAKITYWPHRVTTGDFIMPLSLNIIQTKTKYGKNKLNDVINQIDLTEHVIQ